MAGVIAPTSCRILIQGMALIARVASVLPPIAESLNKSRCIRSGPSLRQSHDLKSSGRKQCPYVTKVGKRMGRIDYTDHPLPITNWVFVYARLQRSFNGHGSLCHYGVCT